jgi:hypothetical protein
MQMSAPLARWIHERYVMHFNSIFPPLFAESRNHLLEHLLTIKIIA